jgi:hypothetical protein
MEARSRLFSRSMSTSSPELNVRFFLRSPAPASLPPLASRLAPPPMGPPMPMLTARRIAMEAVLALVLVLLPGTGWLLEAAARPRDPDPDPELALLPRSRRRPCSARQASPVSPPPPHYPEAATGAHRRGPVRHHSLIAHVVLVLFLLLISVVMPIGPPGSRSLHSTPKSGGSLLSAVARCAVAG